MLLAGVSWTGVALGLAISAIAKSEDVAVTIVPISLIPQVILAGLIAPLAGSRRLLSQLVISAYWGFQGLLGTVPPDVQGRLRRAHTLDLGGEWDWYRIASVLALHVAVCALVALITLCLRDARDSRCAPRWRWLRPA